MNHPKISGATLSAEDIIYLRKSLSVSQDQFSKILNCTLLSVSNWERGVSSPNTQSLKKLGDLMGAIAEFYEAQKEKEALANK